MINQVQPNVKPLHKNITFKENETIRQIFADAYEIGFSDKSKVVKNALNYYHRRMIVPMKNAVIQAGGLN